jgi:biotin transport system substrate-specific component
MLRTLPAPAQINERTWRLAGIVGFTLLMALAAKISINIGPVPFTMQPLVVLLAGMVLGARDGAASLLTYLLLVAVGLPLDARGLGTAALFGPTGGYLVGFVVAAFVVGLLVERASNDKRKGTADEAPRLNVVLLQRFLAGLVGVAVIYLFGVTHLSLYLGRDFMAAWQTGAMPFLIPDAIKALLAAGLTESLRLTLNRQNQK